MGRTVNVRPNGLPNTGGGYWFRYPGSNAVGSGDWSYLADNDDGTHLYGIMDTSDTIEVDFGTYTLAANERAAGARGIHRITGKSSDFNFNLDAWLKPMTMGDGPTNNYQGPHTTPVTQYGSWDWREYSQAAINATRVAYRKNPGGVTTPAIYESYVDFWIQTKPTVSIGSPTSGQRLTTTTPTVTWSYNNQGDPVNAHRVKIFTAATVTGGGFNADTSSAVYDSGRVGGAATSKTSTVALTPGGSYYFYVELATDFLGTDWWSDWASVQFYVKGLPSTSAIGTSPATPITTTLKPNITGTYTDPDGSAAAAFQFKVFSETQYSAAGFDPATATAAWDSGSITSLATASGQTFSYQVGTNLTPNVNYKAYVRAASGSTTWWGAWTGMAAAFVITTAPGLVYDPPATPAIVSAIADQTTQRVAVTVEGRDNLLTRNQSTIDTGTLGWENIGNGTLTRDTTTTLQGGGALKQTSTWASGAALDMTARSGPGGTLASLVQPGRAYTAVASARAGATARSCRVDIRWYDSSGATISTSSGTAANDTTSGWTQLTATATAPANAAYAAVLLIVLATATASEAHYWDNIGLYPGTSTTWYRGGLQLDTRFDLIDAFGRADSASSLGTADQGGAWAVTQNGTGTPAVGITSGRAYVSGIGSATNLHVLPVLTSTVLADGYVQADITLSTVRAAAGVTFHHTSGNDNMMARLVKTSTTDNIQLYKSVAGTYTQLADVATAGLTLGTTYTLRVEFYGGQILVYLNGALRISYLMLPAELNQFGSYGGYGLYLQYTSDTSRDDLGSRFDNFRAGRADPTNRITVERSVDGGTTWAAMRNGVAQNWPYQKATLYDYEVPSGVTARYRAYTTAYESTNLLTSATATAAVQDVALTVADWWLIDPLDPTKNTKILVAPPFRFTRKEPQAVFDPLGRATSVVVSDGQKGIVGSLQVWAKTKADYDALNAVLGSARTLLLKDPLGRSWYVKFGDSQEWELIRAVPASGETTPIRHFHSVTLPFAEVGAPAVV